jgi:hypothetical protein
MNCRGVSRRLSAYIDNNLSPGIRQSVEEHLLYCPTCKRKLSEFEAIITAAHNLTPLSVSDSFQQKVIAAINTRQETVEILTNLRYRLTIAGVAFMVTSAGIFFLIGPPSTKNEPTTYTGRQDSLKITSPLAPDFYSHPETKVKSFPIPEGASQGQLSSDENKVPGDSMRINEFVLPNVQKVNENVNGKF